MAYDQLQPFGDRRSDWQAATICAAVMNAAAMRGGSRKRFRVKDFLLVFKDAETKVKEEKDEPRQTWQEQKLIAQMFVAMSNAEQKQKKRKR